ncbi:MULTISPECIES: hypothetical protein [Methylosinus]|uniref:Uncharacterized protein n=1 Tax=Methylosinus trichosporium (strain ATCC 35070 / NCIMB 11131 / UNIQEM 75 / OB3b) TaxID=595536 RepID=A0A2D2CYU7_METT3|nr:MULTISPECIES: hypothetical protein [Methylosinus]ATQ67922.1 hypothetical protein CQW49_08500 [Methylosinus trichosporium OB3b]OBS53796.1 hypothetical protein A8B73_04700 [Methylosinus sp. 3S-1]
MQTEIHDGADALVDASPCPKSAEEQRAALADLVERGEIATRTRANAAETFSRIMQIPHENRDLVLARQFGEHIGAETLRLRAALASNPAVEIVREIIEEIWRETYDEAERTFDQDPIAIAVALDANAAAWRTLESLISEHAQDAHDEMRAVERIEKARGVDGPACVAFVRGRALGRMLGTIRATFDPSGPIAFDALEEAVTSSFNEHISALESLAAAAPAGAA